MQYLLDLLFNLVFGQAIFFLKHSDKLVVLAVDDIEVVFGQFAESFLYVASDLQPLSLKSFDVHDVPPFRVFFFFLLPFSLLYAALSPAAKFRTVANEGQLME
jgi:hypothetical protein